MVSCPACTASLTQHGKPHCTSQGCVWVKCTKCTCTIDTEVEAYFRGTTLWGNPDGYIKATG